MVQELRDNNIEPTDEYVHEFRVADADGKNRRTGKRGKPVKKCNMHLDIDFMINLDVN
jgi:hypothetical protein